MSARVALAMTPVEAAALFDGWPEGGWLVIRRDGTDSWWDCGPAETLNSMLHGFPCWPPLTGVATDGIDAGSEIDLVRALTATDGVAEAATLMLRERMSCAEEEPELDW